MVDKVLLSSLLTGSMFPPPVSSCCKIELFESGLVELVRDPFTLFTLQLEAPLFLFSLCIMMYYFSPYKI